MTLQHALNLTVGAGTLLLLTLLVAHLAGRLQRYADRTADAAMHRGYEQAPYTAADEPAAALAAAWLADLKEDSQPIDVRRLIAAQDYEIGREFVRRIEAELAASFALVELAGASR